jgi:hypothetical protein
MGASPTALYEHSIYATQAGPGKRHRSTINIQLPKKIGEERTGARFSAPPANRLDADAIVYILI